jgi:hypothetical protein
MATGRRSLVVVVCAYLVSLLATLAGRRSVAAGAGA